jgi:hypothetical protein
LAENLYELLHQTVDLSTVLPGDLNLEVDPQQRIAIAIRIGQGNIAVIESRSVSAIRLTIQFRQGYIQGLLSVLSLLARCNHFLQAT